MKRKRNLYLGFTPARPTRADLVKSRREFKAAVRAKRREIVAEYKRLRKSARSGRTQSTRKLEELFHEVYGPEQNPRILPEMDAEQLAAIRKLIGGKDMAQRKSKSKKKKNGKQPAGLKAYWARKRAAKAKRRNPRKKARARARVRTRTRTVIKYRTRTVKVYPKRKRRKSNPRRKAATIRINAPAGLGPKGLRQFRSMAARAYGAPARIVKR